jgi:hypothetical protein
MLEDMESPTEKLEEQMRETAERTKKAWLRRCALPPAVFAFLFAGIR